MATVRGRGSPGSTRGRLGRYVGLFLFFWKAELENQAFLLRRARIAESRQQRAGFLSGFPNVASLEQCLQDMEAVSLDQRRHRRYDPGHGFDKIVLAEPIQCPHGWIGCYIVSKKVWEAGAQAA